MSQPTKGFIIVAQNSNDCNYIEQAMELAKSIKKSQTIIDSVSIITNDHVPEDNLFDNIIPIPFTDHAANSEWKVENRWKAYHASPYDHTILLDADMLILSDIFYIWKWLDGKELFFTNSVKNFRNQIITDAVFRKTFIENQLPNLYSGFCYFQKSDFALEFWKLVEFITYNWQSFYYEFTPKSTQRFYSLDVTVSLAAKILGIEDQITDVNSPCVFTHMKGLLQGWNSKNPNWLKVAHVHVNSNKDIFINQYKQNGVFHYVEPKFLERYKDG